MIKRDGLRYHHPGDQIDLDFLAIEYALGMLYVEALPDYATELLVAGLESEALACLAGTSKSGHPDDLRELFELGLQECAVEIPPILVAAKQLIVHFAGEVVAGRLPPAHGAATIVGLYHMIDHQVPLSSETFAGDALGVTGILNLYDSFDDVVRGGPQYQEIELEILEECRAMIGA